MQNRTRTKIKFKIKYLINLILYNTLPAQPFPIKTFNLIITNKTKTTMENSFFNSDEKILEEKLNPPVKKRLSKIAGTVLKYSIKLGYKTGKYFFDFLAFAIAFKALSLIFNIHVTIN